MAIRGDYFWTKNFATIFRISQVPMNIVMMTAPLVAGYYYDTTGTYSIPFVGLAFFNFLGAGTILLARKSVIQS